MLGAGSLEWRAGCSEERERERESERERERERESRVLRIERPVPGRDGWGLRVESLVPGREGRVLRRESRVPRIEGLDDLASLLCSEERGCPERREKRG